MAYAGDERAAIEDLGLALVAEGQWAEARVVWEGLAAVDAQAEAPWRLLAVIAARQGRWEDVEALAGAAIARVASGAALLLRAEARWRGGRYAEAAADLEAVTRAPGGAGGGPGEGGESGGPGEGAGVDEELLRKRAAALLARLRRPGR